MGFLDKIRRVRGYEKPRPKKSTDKKDLWIKNFTDYLSNQKIALKNVDKATDNSKKKGKGKRSKEHTFWHEEAGLYIFIPRYGTKHVDLGTDSDGAVVNQIAAESLEEMAGYIDDLIEATRAGEMNDALAQAAARPRKGAVEAGPGNPPQGKPEPAAPTSAPTPSASAPAPSPSGTSTRKSRS